MEARHVALSDHVLLTVEEAAGRLGIGTSTVWRLVANRQLGSVKIGRSRRVPVASLEAFITSLESG